MKNGIKIRNDGIIKLNVSTSNNAISASSGGLSSVKPPTFYKMTLNDIESSGKCIGEGISSFVDEGVYKPLNLKVAIKVIEGQDVQAKYILVIISLRK